MEEHEIWLIDVPEMRRDDLSTMDNYEAQLDDDGIQDWEEGLIRGFMEV